MDLWTRLAAVACASFAVVAVADPVGPPTESPAGIGAAAGIDSTAGIAAAPVVDAAAGINAAAAAAPQAMSGLAVTTPTGVAPSAGPPAASEAAATAVGAASTPDPAGAGPEASYPLADRVVVRKSARKLYLMQQGRVIAEYPVRLGLNPVGPKQREGDFRTPEGVYQLTRRNEYSDFFLSIGVSYPNEGDLVRARKQRVAPGGSIMIHGLPNVPRKPADYYARNDWTDGCIAVSNSDMVDIWLRTRIGIPIEIRP